MTLRLFQHFDSWRVFSIFNKHKNWLQNKHRMEDPVKILLECILTGSESQGCPEILLPFIKGNADVCDMQKLCLLSSSSLLMFLKHNRRGPEGLFLMSRSPFILLSSLILPPSLFVLLRKSYQLQTSCCSPTQNELPFLFSFSFY